jgi:YfiH family protein
MTNLQWLDWPAPASVKACSTLRGEGVSLPPYDTFNLGLHVGDDEINVHLNRQQLLQQIKQSHIHWLQQQHGTRVIDLDVNSETKADASYTQRKNYVCAVMTADCLPVFFCDQQGQQVAIAHAGWRGLWQGVLQNTVSSFKNESSLMAYLGPAISQAAFEVGDDVRDAFLSDYSTLEIDQHFVEGKQENKWMADLYGLARAVLNHCGVDKIYGGGQCTFLQEDKYFSYRRDKHTGRMAHLIWLE